MLFTYTSIDQKGQATEGSIDAINVDVAVTSLQRRGLVISAIAPAGKAGGGFLQHNFSFLEKVSNRDVVLLSRQISTLFQAQVSALRVFRLLGEEVDNPLLGRILNEISSDIQGGSSINKALAKHPKVFSDFYVNMVLAGEESGKLDKTFGYLADYLERTYAVSNKAKNALVYPAFVIGTFVVVIILMLTLVIPKISAVIVDAGQSIPIYTKIVIGISTFFLNYGVFLLLFLIVGGFFLTRYLRTAVGKESFDRFKISIPYVGILYQKLYLSRIADNMDTMIASGITMIRALEICATIVGNGIYARALQNAGTAVKGGSSLSDALSRSPEIPGMMRQMVKVGEETGEVASILSTLARFYEREVETAVDTLVNLIEPVLIILLGIGVAFLLMAVLVPIYSLSSSL